MNDEVTILDKFLLDPTEDSFADLFETFTRRLIAFFRAHRCRWDEAEDLAQEVMLKVYCKASQVRDRKAFRGWLFKVAGNILREHYSKTIREIEAVPLDNIHF